MSRPEPIADAYAHALALVDELGDTATVVAVVRHPHAEVVLASGVAIHDSDGQVITAERIAASPRPQRNAALAAIRGCVLAHRNLQRELRDRLDDAGG